MTKKVWKSNQEVMTAIDEAANKRVTFAGGAQRSSHKPPHFLCPIELIEAVANTRLEGDKKYAPGNWTKGDKAFFVDCLGHAIEHLYEVAFPTDLTENVQTHLGHAGCNIAFILWALKQGKITQEDFSNVAKVWEKK